MRHALVLLLAACSPMKVVFDDTQVDTAIGVDDDTGPTLFPELVVDPTSLDLGVVAPSEEVSGIVTVGNDGDWPMVVSVSVTEGATWFRADSTDFTVAPGAASNVRITALPDKSLLSPTCRSTSRASGTSRSAGDRAGDLSVNCG